MTRILSLLIALILVSVTMGCSVAPSENKVAAAITEYFEASHYRVVDLRIGKIEDVPLAQKSYMGTPGYVVDIVSITLEPQEDIGADIRKGSVLTFTNAIVRVREDAVNKNAWHVSVVSGISLP